MAKQWALALTGCHGAQGVGRAGIDRMRLHVGMAAAAWTLLGSASGWAQQGVQPVVPPANPTAEAQCVEFRSAWYQRIRELEQSRAVCERRDGGTVRANGPWLPNCGARQQAYVTCAGISDQICWATNQMNEQGRQCSRQAAAYLSQQRQQKNQAQRAEEQVRRSIEAIQNARSGAAGLLDKGVTGTVMGRFVGTPEGGGLHDAARDAARTVNAPGADSQPLLNDMGARSDELHRALVRNPLVAEPGVQSNATSRARMGDALNQLDGALQSAPDIERATTAAPAPVYAPPSWGRMSTAVPAGDPSEASAEDGQDEKEREAARARLQMLETLNKGLQDLLERSRR